ncbi:cytochrome P450 [Hypoxylon trugodes]|uniref:cytochrome P450 n=1 Tax=Hypoxylon trugodes TaxID=326681 RepID=UPI002192ACBE|nr:cytochrome P450 [Hypoxylon trugodes]KAI1389444.1 cytochrome P450 [Hypoxylon trugodes]
MTSIIDALRGGLPPPLDHGYSYSLAIIASVILLLYVLALAFYRLYLSPLAKYPGPRLVALTQWYETYHDVFKQGGGRFIFEIARMHEKYGPIVRINPFELHIDDPTYYDVLYTNHPQYDKLPFLTNTFDKPLTSFATNNSVKHRQRRSAFAPFFSRAKIRERDDLIKSVMNRISHRLSTEYAGTGKVFNILHVWASLSTDVIMEIAFCQSTQHVDSPDFKSDFTVATVFSTHVITHFKFITTFINLLPKWLAKIAVPSLETVIRLEEELYRQVVDIINGGNIEAKESQHPTLVHEILSSRLPPEELTPERLTQESISVGAAGFETTRWTMGVASYHILANPKLVEERLKAELMDAIPDPNNIPHWMELEKLDYLKAVVNESLRMSIGATERLARVNPSSAWKYRDYVIPSGIPVSMDNYHMLRNPVLFPDPDVFLPDRWLGNPMIDPAQLEAVGYLPPLDGKPKPLLHYMVAFGRGSRMCPGMELAYAEIYIGLATLFRRHELELFETTHRDVDFARDLVTAHPEWGSKGIRVVVKK